MPSAHPYIDLWNAIIPPASNTLALVLSTLSLIVTLINFRRKRGTFVRGTFKQASSLDCEDEYVSSITLENLKDRAVTIFEVYLRLGSNNFIKLIDFKDAPLILGAYGTFQKEFDVIQFYKAHSNRIDLNALFNNSRIKKRLILSTTDGKYVVPAPIHIWNATDQYFSNYSTVNVETIRFEFNGKNIGWNVDYILDLTEGSGKKTSLLIHRNGHKIPYIKHFEFTPESLESVGALDAFLQSKKIAGLFPCDWQIQDIRSLREHYYTPYLHHSIQAHVESSFRYVFIGKLRTILANFRMRKQWRKIISKKIPGGSGTSNHHEQPL